MSMLINVYHVHAKIPQKPKKELNHLALELYIIVSCDVGAMEEARSSTRAVCPLQCELICPVPE